MAPISKEQLNWLFEQILESETYHLTIDVLNQTISTLENVSINFSIDQSNKDRVIYGYDDIELTLKNRDQIKAFEKKIKSTKPWLSNNENEEK